MLISLGFSHVEPRIAEPGVPTPKPGLRTRSLARAGGRGEAERPRPRPEATPDPPPATCRPLRARAASTSPLFREDTTGAPGRVDVDALGHGARRALSW